MVKMRLKRMGSKGAPFYRIVIADARAPRDGRFVEEVGYYDPTKEPSVIKIDQELATKWLSQGAQPTETVKKLLKIAGVEIIAKSLVDHPEQVSVSEEMNGEEQVISLKVAPEDMGKVIGKQGRIAKAIRTVVKAAAIKQDAKVSVEIVQ